MTTEKQIKKAVKDWTPHYSQFTHAEIVKNCTFHFLNLCLQNEWNPDDVDAYVIVRDWILAYYGEKSSKLQQVQFYLLEP